MMTRTPTPVPGDSAAVPEHLIRYLGTEYELLSFHKDRWSLCRVLEKGGVLVRGVQVTDFDSGLVAKLLGERRDQLETKLKKS